MKAVLSDATATAAVPAGQPDPLTVTTSITTLSGGGTRSAADDGVNDAATSATAAPPIITGLIIADVDIAGLNMGPPAAVRTRWGRPCHHRRRGVYRSS
ncbi:hypothetical protein GCM10010319_64770 [Streptomyces blastmyceticus]|uniref:Uncharacterized protein n=1 Tax=Streptomyces blastmyceticus TaxID=68180 RepID=A0ABN0XYS6_9ACTN